MRLKKSMRVKKSAPRVKKSPLVKGAIGTQAIFLVVLGVAAAAAMLIASAGSSRPADVAAGGAQQERMTHATARKSAASGALDATLVRGEHARGGTPGAGRRTAVDLSDDHGLPRAG